MKEAKKKIFLTGANGMVGKNICKYLPVDKYEIDVPSRKELDLNNYDDLRNHLMRFKPDIVIHAAGKVGGIQANINNNLIFFTENLNIGLNVVKASYDIGIKKLINLGSSCFYPSDFENSITEENLLQGPLEKTNEGYALAKLNILKFCEYVNASNPDFLYKTLIPCNLFGEFDSFDEGKSHLVPAIIKKLHLSRLSGNPYVEIWGDGTVKREFMFCKDFVSFLFFSIDKIEALPNHLNVGVGCDMTINDYYKSISKILGIKVNFTHLINKPVGMKRKLLNIDKMLGLGWNDFTNFEKAVLETYDYYKSTIGED